MTLKKKRKRAIILLACTLAIIIALFGIIRESIQKAIYPYKYQSAVESSAKEFNVDPALILAIINTESSFQPDAISDAGAIGLMQIMPDTFNFISVNGNFNETNIELLYVPDVNIRFGSWLISYLINKYGNLDTALCAYNAGIGRVNSWLMEDTISADGKNIENIPFDETKDYVKKVKKAYDIYKEIYFK